MISMGDETITNFVMHILQNYRVGIVVNQTTQIFHHYIVHNYRIETDENYFFIYPEYNFNSQNYFPIDAYTNTKTVIHQNIKLMMIWVINIFHKILLQENLISIDCPFCEIVLNYIELENYINLTELHYRSYLYKMKSIKDEMISLSVNQSLKKNIEVTKRINSKPRIKRRLKKF
jgi:hypothetical protein